MLAFVAPLVGASAVGAGALLSSPLRTPQHDSSSAAVPGASPRRAYETSTVCRRGTPCGCPRISASPRLADTDFRSNQLCAIIELWRSAHQSDASSFSFSSVSRWHS